MNLWVRILKWAGWETDITVPQQDKCVICVAPHTSNWDFILGLAAYRSLGRKANFLMKEFWFFFPLNFILKSLGGIPVSRSGSGGTLTNNIIRQFETRSYMNLAVTPEGTRSPREKWRTGFLYIAYGAKVPIQLGVIDYKRKKIMINDEYIPSGDIDIDLKEIKKYYSGRKDAARYPENFII